MYLPTISTQRGAGLASSTAMLRPSRKLGKKPAVQIKVSIDPSVSATPPASTSSTKWIAERVPRASGTSIAPNANVSRPSATVTPELLSLAASRASGSLRDNEVGAFVTLRHRDRTLDGDRCSDRPRSTAS